MSANKQFKERIRKQKEEQEKKRENYFKKKIGGVMQENNYKFNINDSITGIVDLKTLKFGQEDFDLLKAIVIDYMEHRELTEGEIIEFSKCTDCMYNLKIEKIKDTYCLMEVC